MATQRFQDMQKKKLPKKFSLKSGGKAFVIEVIVENDDMGKKIERVNKTCSNPSPFTLNPVSIFFKYQGRLHT